MNNYTQTRSPIGELIQDTSFFGATVASRHIAYENESTFNSENSKTLIASTSNLPLSNTVESNRMSYKYKDIDYILDADTFRIEGMEENIRLYGVEAPETSSKAKIEQYKEFGRKDKADALKPYAKNRGLFGPDYSKGDYATTITEQYFQSSDSFNVIKKGSATGSNRILADIVNERGELLSVELLRQGGGLTSLPGDRFFERDEYTNDRIEAFLEAYENNRGIFADQYVEDPVYTRYLKNVSEGKPVNPVYKTNIRDKIEAYSRRKKFTDKGITNAHYLSIISSDEKYFTLKGSRGSSEHYQQSLYRNLMKQGGYNNLAQERPFEGVASSLVKTNMKLLYGVNAVEDKDAGAATLFMAQQFDKGLYTAGLGEYLNSNLFIPNGFGRAYKDDKGFIGSVAGFAGRMLDESYLYYANVSPDTMLIGNEYQEGQGMGPLTASKPGLFESTFTRAAEYTVAMAQSLGMYVAITQPIEMLKASIYKDVLDSTLTASMSKTSTNKGMDYLIRGFYFGFEASEPHEVLQRMFEVDQANQAKVTLPDGRTIQRQQTSFFDHNQTHKTGFGVQQFVTRGRAQVMLEATFKPLLKEVINPFDIGAVNQGGQPSFYRQFNTAVDELIETISAPAGLVANFDAGSRFTFLPKGTDSIQSSSGNFRLELIGKPIKKSAVNAGTNVVTEEGLSSPIVWRFNKDLKKVQGVLSINLGVHKDISVGSYTELQNQYNRINGQLDTQIKAKYNQVISSSRQSTRKKYLSELKDLEEAQAQVTRRLGEAFEMMSLETKNIGVGRKKNIARKLQAVLDMTPVNPFKWGILSGTLSDKRGTLMIGQLFSFENTARMAEAAVTGDGKLNRLFRQAQESKMAEFRKEDIDAEKIRAYARAYNFTDTVHASMKTFDNLGQGIWTSAKDFARSQSESARASVIARASKNLRRAEIKTVSKKGFWGLLKGGFTGDYGEIDQTALSLDKNLPGKLMVKKKGGHILNAIADYEEVLQRTQGFGLEELGKNFNPDEMNKLMRVSGEDNIQGGINRILSGKGANLSAEIVTNNRIKGVIAGLVFASIVGNSIFQSTGGASLTSQIGLAVYGEKADIALEFEGNRFLPTELIHTGLEKTFGAAPSMLALNTLSEVGFIAGTTYFAHKMAQSHSYYQTLQYSYSLEDLGQMSANGENIKLVRRTSNILNKVQTYDDLDISDLAKAAEDIATNSANRGKLYLQLINDSKTPPKYISVSANATGNVLTTGKVVQTLIKDVPINTMIYASVALLATAGLREIAANTLQIFASSTNDNTDNSWDIARGLGAVGGIASGVFFTAGYFKKFAIDDVLQIGDVHRTNNEFVQSQIETATRRLAKVNDQIDYLSDFKYQKTKGPVTAEELARRASFDSRRDTSIQAFKEKKAEYTKVLQDKNKYQDFLSTKKGKRYAWLTGGSPTASMLRKINPGYMAVGTLAVTAVATSAIAYYKYRDRQVDYSGSFDPLVAGGLAMGAGLALTKSPAGALAIGAVAALGAYYVNWAGFKIFKVGNANKSVDADQTRMISQLGRFTEAVTSNADLQSTLTLETSGYASQFTSLADKGLFGESERVKDKVRVIAKQVPLPMLQFFVAEKVSGNYGEGRNASLDNERTQRVYSVGVQSGALFGMSMALQLPVMYTPGRGFAGFSYNPDHNLDKLPNALASIAAYSNIYMGGLAVITSVGGLLPGEAGKGFKNFSSGFGDFNRGVQNLTRNVNGFYIEQVSRTFTKLNLIDTQLLVQSVGDKIYQDMKLEDVKVKVSNKIDEGLKAAFINDEKILRNGGIRLKDGTIIKPEEFNIANLQKHILQMDDADAETVRSAFRRTRKDYYDLNKIGTIEQRLIDKKIGNFNLDTLKSYRKGKMADFLSGAGNFTRQHGINLTLLTIGVGMAANLVGKALDARDNELDSSPQARANRDKWNSRTNLMTAGSMFGGAISYVVVSKGQVILRDKLSGFIANQVGKNKIITHVAKRAVGYKKVGMIFALGAAASFYNYIKTSSQFGIARYMDHNIKYDQGGAGAVRGDNNEILYEKNEKHHFAVSIALGSYTAGMFAAASGPFRSMQQMNNVLMEEFNGVKPTGAQKVWQTVNGAWETFTGSQRRIIAREQVEGLLKDVSRLQFNDIDEFHAYYNIDAGVDNPMNRVNIKQQQHLYELKSKIREDLRVNLGGKEIPNEFIDKYLGLHKKIQEYAAKQPGQISLLDATKFVTPDEADEYKAFMKAVGSSINHFGQANPGVQLTRSKFTRNLSTKVAATLVLMATAREIFKGIDNMSMDPLGRADKPGLLDRLYNKASSKGMWGQIKPGGGKVGFLDGSWAIAADAMRIITGRDRIDIGIIADQISGQVRPVGAQKLIGTKKDFRSAQQLIQEVGAGFVLDDSNAYLAIGTFGGVTFRKGDHGFRTSSYFQLQSAGQDISTATYTMATKFYHGAVAGQGVELSSIVDAATRNLEDSPSAANLQMTAILIRNATSMQHPLQKVRKMSRTPGSVRGDRLANLIRSAREEAGRQLNRQSVTSIYTENYYTQLDIFEKKVGGDFFRSFLKRVATNDDLGLSLLGDVLTGTFGYNPNNRNTISSVIFFSQGEASKIKRNQKGENISLLGDGNINLSYQNESFEQSRSTLFDYTFNSLNAMIDQGLLNFLPDYVKSGAKQLLAIGVGFGALTALSNWGTSRQFADKMANQDFTNDKYQFTAHEDTGKAVNQSREKIKELNRNRAQSGADLYSFGEDELFPNRHYINEAGQDIENYVKSAREAGSTKSFNKLMYERSRVGESRAVITMSDMQNNVSYRFEMSDSIRFAQEDTLNRVTKVMSDNQSFRIVNLEGNANADFRNRLWGREFMERDLNAAAPKGNMVAHLQELTAQDPVKASRVLRQVVKDRITSTYSEMIQELYGGGFDKETGRLSSSGKNRYLEEVKMTEPMADGTRAAARSQTIYETIKGTFSDEEILNEMRTNPDIVESMEGIRPAQASTDYGPRTPLLFGESSLTDLSNVNDDHIMAARKSLVVKHLDGNYERTARQLETQIHKLIEDKLDDLGISIDKNGRITTTKFEAGRLNQRQLLEQVQSVSIQVVDEVEAQGLLQAAQRNMGILEVESANSAGLTKRLRDRILSRNQIKKTGMGLIEDVAQFRGARAIAEGGLANALKGAPMALETFGLFNDAVQGLDVFGAYARVSEAMHDPFQTEQDVVMAKRELGKSIITAGIGLLIGGIQMKVMGGAGFLWKKANMNLAKLIGYGTVAGIGGTLLGGFAYKGLIKPALQSTKRMMNESEAVKNLGDTFNKGYNMVADSLGYAASIPVEMANKWGVQNFGPETGKKVTFAMSQGIGGAVTTGLVMAGIAIGGALFGAAVAFSAPVTLGLLALGFGAGAISGFVFTDANATVSTKLLQEIPKIPVIGPIIGGLITTPYKSIRSEERFKHHYKNSPFTSGYAGDIVNQKWMSLLAAADDPTGADMVSNMFGEIIRPTEYETSAWKINSSNYGSNPIPIVDGVIQRELRLRSTYYSDLIIGRYTWGQILKNSDQSENIEEQIKAANAKQAAILSQNKANAMKGARQGGSSVPVAATTSSQNAHTKNAELASAIAVEEVKKKASEFKETSVVYSVETAYADINSPKETFSKNNKNITLNGGFPIQNIPMEGIEMITARVTFEEGTVQVEVSKEDDPYSDVIRQITINNVRESEDPDPSNVSQQRSYVMMANQA